MISQIDHNFDVQKLQIESFNHGLRIFFVLCLLCFLAARIAHCITKSRVAKSAKAAINDMEELFRHEYYDQKDSKKINTYFRNRFRRRIETQESEKIDKAEKFPAEEYDDDRDNHMEYYNNRDDYIIDSYMNNIFRRKILKQNIYESTCISCISGQIYIYSCLNLLYLISFTIALYCSLRKYKNLLNDFSSKKSEKSLSD